MAIYILPFEKMHGLGNDFILIHEKHLPQNINEQNLAKILCNRHYSIGADGLIIVKNSLTNSSEADFVWSYINSDGSYGQMCGNGMRCFAKYVFDRGLTNKSEFTVETLAGIMQPSIQPDGQIKVNMGNPKLKPSEIPLSIELNAEQLIDYKIQILDQEFSFTPVSMGNPHAIVFLNNLAEFENLDLEKYGSVFEKHNYFPEKTNVEFAFVQDENIIDLKVWERGCGITLACGTGACATVVAAHLKNLISAQGQLIQVNLPGGTLNIEWNKENNNIYMTGSAESVFIGQLEIDLLDQIN
jgi:diaminopimelate epimerase